MAGGLAGGLITDSGSGTIAGAQAGKTTTENNALSDITEALAAGKTPQQVAEERVEAENERYRKENCAGMSAEACSAKMYNERRETLKDICRRARILYRLLVILKVLQRYGQR